MDWNEGSGGKGLEESAIGAFSLVVLAVDYGVLHNVILFNELQSVLILSLNKLVLLPCNSILIALQV